MGLLNQRSKSQNRRNTLFFSVLIFYFACQNLSASDANISADIDNMAIENQVMLDKKMQEVEGDNDIHAGTHNHQDCLVNGVGLGGYDPVSYRSENGPLLGEESYFSDYQDVRYLFISAENKAAFDKSPSYYLPQYSGFCAIALALGKVVCPDYQNYQIENDQLLLFETTGFTNGRVIWNSNRDRFRTKADSNFRTILK